MVARRGKRRAKKMSQSLSAAEKLARDAERVQAAVDRARPEWSERIQSMVSRAPVDLTGQPVELR